MPPGRNVSAGRKHFSERDQLDLFRALSGDLATREAQEMAHPFFSLAKSKRAAPIDFHAGTVSTRVEAVPEHRMPPIWDAVVLIGAASRIVEVRDAGLSPMMAATPHEILTFAGCRTRPFGFLLTDTAISTAEIGEVLAAASTRWPASFGRPCSPHSLVNVELALPPNQATWP